MDAMKMDAFKAFHNDWALLTAGTMDCHNTMTIGWGGLGCLWGKQVATVFVRPNRYTYEFMEREDFFTVSFFDEDCRDALKLLGRKSGRDGDKIAEAGLHAQAMQQSVSFREARLTLLCRKIYHQDLDPDAIDPDARRTYYGEGNPLHRMYVGEVVAVQTREV